jgi:hypothetical protein
LKARAIGYPRTAQEVPEFLPEFFTTLFDRVGQGVPGEVYRVDAGVVREKSLGLREYSQAYRRILEGLK